MNNSKDLFQEFLKQIILKDDPDENRSMAYMVFDKLFGLSRTDVLSNSAIDSSVEKINKLKEIAERINRQEPIQYILGETYFFDRQFYVDNRVLIPRPETEELVRLIVNHCELSPSKHPKILDIGTGSGCIPITLALELPHADVYACDISKDALQVASQNAASLKANVTFFECDILQEEISHSSFEIIVSNPPYITLKEKHSMMPNVIDHEPHLALFVDDDDPLVFYKAITTKAKMILLPRGLVVVEINEQYGDSVKQLFLKNGFTSVEIIKDLSGKDRIVKGILA
jgi:release factor glutamine methyltransferase